MSNKRVMVTGGAGFIGSELTRQLVAAGEEVVVVDNLVNGKAANLAGLPQLDLQVVDIRQQEKMSVLLKGVERVYHLACLGVRHSLHAPWENHEVNASATLNLLRLAMEAQVERFIQVSTSEVYGTARRVPMDEEHPTLPSTVYGASKLAGEGYARAYWHSYGYPTVVVRPFNAFGPRCHHEGDSGEVIPKFMLRAMAGLPMIIFGDGQQTRDFTHVSDTARGILLAGQQEQAVGQIINLGSGQEVTILQLAQHIAQVVGVAEATIQFDAPRPGDVLRLLADSGKAKEWLAFTPKVTLEEGLRDLHSWYGGQGVDVATLLQQEFTHNWRSRQPSAPGT
ncbi:MAG: NAD-dependent epimerase/dehydratase family protein [Magnetococcales bacterium]|nr:GDP-mannose 4,6-dehydratase [Magnetococcales bacterium]NGZ28843.1 NAD-dependent epimerase/dehydratase family protein [Magnetococcales bacterium]